MEKYNFTVDEESEGARLDQFLTAVMEDISRSRVQALIKEGNVCIEGRGVTSRSVRVKEGEEYSIEIPPAKDTDIRATEIPLNIVFEDEHMLVIDKEAGMTVHPGAGNHNDTMVNALLAYCGDDLSGIGGVARPGIVHRLDKDTSGLLVVAKNDKAHKKLSEQLADRSLKRIYHALIWGILDVPVGKIETNIGRHPRDRKRMAVLKSTGRKAVTHYKILEKFAGDAVSLVECRLETGRTHQIRVHLTHRNHPLIGDQTYSCNVAKYISMLPEESREYVKNFRRQALHSSYIGFIHPDTGNYLEFNSNFAEGEPKDLFKLLECLKGLPKG